ncbi:basic-leucine zipper transcription factor [Phycomyces blakesleeanus]
MLSTERKDKNRLAQAAFRARQANYSRQRDNALLKLEAKISSLEKSHQEAINRAHHAEQNYINLANELYNVQQQLSLSMIENEYWRSCLTDLQQSMITRFFFVHIYLSCYFLFILIVWNFVIYTFVCIFVLVGLEQPCAVPDYNPDFLIVDSLTEHPD